MTGISWDTDPINVYQTATGSVVLNDANVSKLFVDWGDGPSRTLEKGTNQWINIDKPTNTVSIEHIYTQTGTFKPVVRTVDNLGFVSKYYGSSSANSDLSPYESVGSRIQGITINDATPLGMIKLENKQVLSGIDNNIFDEGPKLVYIQPAPTIASGTSTDLVGASLKIQAECVVAIANNPNDISVGYETTIQTLEKTFTLNDRVRPETAPTKLDDKYIIKVLKVKLMTPKLDISDSLVQEFNKLKIFLTAEGDDNDLYPITYVTNGDPIKTVDDSRRVVTVDYEESRAKASNVLLSHYNFDNGKVFWQPKHQWQASSATAFTDNTKTSNSLLSESYTYYPRPDGLKGSNYLNTVSNSAALYSGNAWLYESGEYDFVRDQFLINEFNQFVDYNHLVRMTTTTASDKTNPVDTFDLVYKIQPPELSIGKTAYFVNGANDSDAGVTQYITPNDYYNTASYPVSTSKWNDQSFVDSEGNAREASSYFILGNTQKTNKIFVNISPYARKYETGLSEMHGIVIKGIYYLRLSNDIEGDKFTQKAEWVPLRFEDGTKVEKIHRDSSSEKFIEKSSSLAKSGYLTFDMPTDWSKTSMPDLCGGFFNVSGLANTVTDVTNDYSIGFHNLSLENNVSSSGVTFGYIPLTGSDVGTNLADYTDDEIGHYKYLFQVSGGASAGECFWVASSSIATNRIYLASGTHELHVSKLPATLDGFMRRVNAYEVFDGASKTSDEGLPPHYIKNPGNSYSYTFMFGGDLNVPTFVSNLTPAIVSGTFQNVYPLKIVASGEYMDETSSTSHPPDLEIWNLLPFNSSSAQVITQKDNTAYDLNYIAITSDISVTYAGTYYQAITKAGRVFIIRTGTPIQTITFNGVAMGDESSFKFSAEYTGYYTLRKLRRAQAYATRVMWDEQQKDGTYVRYFGVITTLTETHKVTGKRATKPFNFSMVVEEICLLDKNGNLMSEIEPLGGIPDDSNFK
tara:strand:+ start:12835 stop:15744 length:2910 start_codon:yes stop_codon:yes gene_type:complete